VVWLQFVELPIPCVAAMAVIDAAVTVGDTTVAVVEPAVGDLVLVPPLCLLCDPLARVDHVGYSLLNRSALSLSI
jgi:hypothetical protein